VIKSGLTEFDNTREVNGMSITMNLYYTGVDGNARKFAEEMESTGVAGQIRAEEGNLKYEYYIPLKDPETVLLIDSWEDQEAIDRHHASPMMKKIAELRKKHDLHMTAERYVSDTDGIPQKDREFIRQ
jgi:quinol monooxygenase YgiN